MVGKISGKSNHHCPDAGGQNSEVSAPPCICTARIRSLRVAPSGLTRFASKTRPRRQGLVAYLLLTTASALNAGSLSVPSKGGLRRGGAPGPPTTLTGKNYAFRALNNARPGARSENQSCFILFLFSKICSGPLVHLCSNGAGTMLAFSHAPTRITT